MRLTYVGPCAEVEIPGVELTCKRGETIEVPDEAVANGLLEQATWNKAKAAAPVEKQAKAEEAK